MPCTTFVKNGWTIAISTHMVYDTERADHLNILVYKGAYKLGLFFQVPHANNRYVVNTSHGDEDITIYVTTSQSRSNNTLFVHIRVYNESFQQWLTLRCPSLTQ